MKVRSVVILLDESFVRYYLQVVYRHFLDFFIGCDFRIRSKNVFGNKNSRALVVLGAPGCGKSTFFDFIIVVC